MPFERLLAGSALSILLLVSGLSQNLYGQTGDITAQIHLRDPVTQAQVLSLSTLGINRRGKGQPLGTLVIQNNSAEPQHNLYFFIKVENTSNVLARLNQEQERPFSLDAGQVIQASNNRLQEGVPGIRNPKFTGGLTNAGRQFVNDLEGQTQLPNDQFTVTLEIYQGSNRKNGGQRVARASATVGASPTPTVSDLYLNRPGGEVGSGLSATINTQRPTFNWAGETGIKYRVVIVRSTGMDSPESLITSAEETDPVLVNGTSRNNTLLEHEMADARLSTNTFQYPASAVKQLQPGRTYLWRVSALLQTASGETVVPSEIWRFSIAESQTERQSTPLSEDLAQTLRTLLDKEQFSSLQSEGLTPQSIVLNGQKYSGAAMRQQLTQFLNRARRGEITITNTEEQP